MPNFSCNFDARQVAAIPSLGLAHLGDGVYELLVRTMLVERGEAVIGKLHRATVSYVSAPAQAQAAQKIQPLLTESELGYYRRGRNAPVHQIPKNATHAQYSRATGLEALFGALYLLGQKDRICELFAAIMEEPHAT